MVGFQYDNPVCWVENRLSGAEEKADGSLQKLLR